VLVLIGGGTAAVAAFTEDRTRIVTAVGGDRRAAAAAPPAEAAAGAVVPRPPSADAGLGEQATAEEELRPEVEEADRTATRTPRKEPVEQQPQVAAPRVTAAEPAAPARPMVTTRNETEKRMIPFRTRLVRDPALPRGRKRIQAPGAPGEEILRYVVTLTDGEPTERRLIGSTVTRQPQHRVVAFGTRRGPRECRPGNGCAPTGRVAGCAQEPLDPATESGSLPLGGSATLLDEDLALLDAKDLDGLELEPGLLC
jgi:hypothetical protein